MRVELELRNLPRFCIIEYLTEAGGTALDALNVAGEGWGASLHPMLPVRVGSIIVARDLLVIEGRADAVADVHAMMRRKAMRGGG